jgi:hypothetical protein
LAHTKSNKKDEFAPYFAHRSEKIAKKGLKTLPSPAASPIECRGAPNNRRQFDQLLAAWRALIQPHPAPARCADSTPRNALFNQRKSNTIGI